MAWEGLPDDLRLECVRRGELLRGYVWPGLPTLFLQFARVGNRSDYEHVNRLRRAARSAIWFLQSASRLRDAFWMTLPMASGSRVRRLTRDTQLMSTLSALAPGYPTSKNLRSISSRQGNCAAQLAWTHYLLGTRLDGVSPLVRRRVGYERSDAASSIPVCSGMISGGWASILASTA